jgi:LEA14-like dessication related protein
MNFTKFSALILVLFIGVSCVTTKMVEYTSPEVTINDIEVGSIDFDGLTLSSSVKMNNSQLVDATVVEHNYNVIVADQIIVSGNFDRTFELDQQQSKDSQHEIYIPFSELFSRFGSFGDMETIPVIIESTIKSKQSDAASDSLLVQIDAIKTRIPVLQLPRIVVDKLELKSFNLAVAELDLSLRIVNPNPFPVIVNSVDFDIMVDGTRWNNQQVNQRFEVPIRSDIVINTPFSMRPRDFSTEVYRMLNMSQEFEFNVIGSVYYDIELPNFRGGDATPFRVSQFQKFDRLGN